MSDYIQNTLVYTNEHCIGCNKCISVCPVLTANQAMEENGTGKIAVNGANCIACGACIDACQHDARSFEDDTERFFKDLKNGVSISLLLAPAFLANYPQEYGKVLGGLKKLGVNRIISVSFGADITTWGYINHIAAAHASGSISQPCPAIVSYIEKYIPELIPKLMPVHSPLLCTAIYLKKYEKLSDKLAFISPCIAKKAEIEDPNTNGYVSYNVTFDHLMKYVGQHQISGPEARDEIQYGLGAVYPMPGGLKENVYWFCGEDAFVRQVEGEKHAYEYLEQYAKRAGSHGELPFLVDALNCSQGCLYGTGAEASKADSDSPLFQLNKIKAGCKKSGKGQAFGKNLTPRKRLEKLNKQFSKLNLKDFMRTYRDLSRETQIRYPNKEELSAIFMDMGKMTLREQTIDCSACGYKSCQDMAVAIYNGCNSKTNCIHYIKEQVEKDKELAEKLSRELQDKNNRITSLLSDIASDFESLDHSISDMAAGNHTSAEESSGISMLMNEVMEFSQQLTQALGAIEELLGYLQKNNSDITDVADETNLLSLNASIEAARAGIAGRGFAIIAENIKKLSESSKDTAGDSDVTKNKIQGAVMNLKEKTGSLIQVIEGVNAKVTNLAATTQEIAALTQMLNDVSAALKDKLKQLI